MTSTSINATVCCLKVDGKYPRAIQSDQRLEVDWIFVFVFRTSYDFRTVAHLLSFLVPHTSAFPLQMTEQFLFSFETGFHIVISDWFPTLHTAKPGFKLLVPLLLSLKGWDYRHVPPGSVSMMLKIKP